MRTYHLDRASSAYESIMIVTATDPNIVSIGGSLTKNPAH
jgi:hypothetical protein